MKQVMKCTHRNEAIQKRIIVTRVCHDRLSCQITEILKVFSSMLTIIIESIRRKREAQFGNRENHTVFSTCVIKTNCQLQNLVLSLVKWKIVSHTKLIMLGLFYIMFFGRSYFSSVIYTPKLLLVRVTLWASNMNSNSNRL